MNKKSLRIQLIKAFLIAVPLAFVFNIVGFTCFALLMGELPKSRDFLSVFDLKDRWTLIFTVVHFGFAFLQAFLLLVPVIPAVSLSEQKQALWPRVVGAAFLCSVAITIPVMAGIDILGFTHYDKAIHGLLIKSALGVWFISWVIWTSFIWRGAKKNPTIVFKRANSGAQFSLVGMAICVPWYLILRKKTSCACNLATFYSLIAGIMSLLVVGGPLLLVLARDRKIRKVFDS